MNGRVLRLYHLRPAEQPFQHAGSCQARRTAVQPACSSERPGPPNSEGNEAVARYSKSACNQQDVASRIPVSTLLPPQSDSIFTPAGRPQVHKEEDAMGCWNPLWCSCWACCRAPQRPAPGGPACIPEAMSAAARSPVLLAATQTFTRRSSKDLKTKQPASCTAYMPVLRPSCWQQPP